MLGRAGVQRAVQCRRVARLAKGEKMRRERHTEPRQMRGARRQTLELQKCKKASATTSFTGCPNARKEGGNKDG